MITVYDKEKEFDKDCRERLEELRSYCVLHNIPFYFTACIKNNEEESVYVSEGSLTGSSGIKLKNDRLKKHLLVGLDFDVVPKREELEIQMIDPDQL